MRPSDDAPRSLPAPLADRSTFDECEAAPTLPLPCVITARGQQGTLPEFAPTRPPATAARTSRDLVDRPGGTRRSPNVHALRRVSVSSAEK